MKTNFISLLTTAFLLTLNSCNSPSNTNSTGMKMQCEVTGHGRPIVLVPGGLTGWESWAPFVKTFTDKEKTVIRVQLLGVEYGLENRPLPEDYSVKTESGALASTLDSLGYTMPVDVVAWSFGAFTALDFALDHSDRIRTLTLIEPPAMWVLRGTEKWDDDAQHSADFFETQKGDIPEEMLEEFLVRAGFVQPGQSVRDLPQWNHWVPFRQSLRMNPSVVSFRDDVERIRAFQPPVLLVKGTGSSPFLHNIIDVLSESFPHSRVVEFPAGHAPHIVSKDKFIEELDRFQTEAK